nr:butyrophilin subfamily 3 member A3-like isoform X2 [Pelodiscus sinensis]|eukprot:XP_014428295.1 butyrophilin subfamily 3 member A3-like isoform X2 [Pelodiscus sinensis]
MRLLGNHRREAIISLPGLTLFFVHLPIHTLESAQFTVTGPDQPIIAIVGEDVVLSCHLSPTMSAEDMEVRWYRSDFSSPVHLYRYGKDQYEQQMPEYTGRTDFLRDGIRDGRVALMLRKVTPTDEGQYRCYFQSTAFYGDAILELQVVALGSAPLISVEDYQDGGIRVVCRSAGWYPKPQVFWQDLTGRRVPSLSETKSGRHYGLFEIEASVIVKETSNISCSIRDALLKQEKKSTINIAEPIFPKLSPWITIPCTILVIEFFVICSLLYYFKTKGWRNWLRKAEQLSLDPHTANPFLLISPDGKRVRLEVKGKDQEEPGYSEGFSYSPCVLACQGFTQGRHYWGVEVGSKGGWAVGVAKQSVRTKEGVVSLKPEDGVWVIERQWWGQFWALSNPVTPLSLSKKPEKIRISLDYDMGLVEFFDADDVIPLYTFAPASFEGETIFPFFRVGGAGAHLRLCP